MLYEDFKKYDSNCFLKCFSTLKNIKNNIFLFLKIYFLNWHIKKPKNTKNFNLKQNKFKLKKKV